MLTVKEFIHYTGYKSQTVYSYIRNNKIKAVKLGSKYVISIEEADKWKAKKNLWDALKKS